MLILRNLITRALKSYYVLLRTLAFGVCLSLSSQGLGQNSEGQNSSSKELSDTEQSLSKSTRDKKTQKSSNEEKLETVRELLISEALKAKARIKASSWIDNDGALHENLYVLSEAYAGKSGLGRPSIDIENFNINNLESEKKGKYCRFANPTYARVAELNVVVGRSSLEIPFNDLNMIKSTIEKTFKDGLSSHQKWLFVSKKPVFNTNYERYLSSSSVNLGEYEISLNLEPIEKFSYRKKRNHTELKLVLVIKDIQKNQIIVSSQKFLPSPWADPPIPAPRSGIEQVAYSIYEANQVGKFPITTQKAFSSSFVGSVLDSTSQLVKKTILAFDCRQISFPISEISDNIIHIEAGYERGLRIGDQLLLTDSQMSPHRILEEAAIEKIALVEIESVTAYKAKAIKVAGPNLGPVSRRGRTNVNVTPF